MTVTDLLKQSVPEGFLVGALSSVTLMETLDI